MSTSSDVESRLRQCAAIGGNGQRCQTRSLHALCWRHRRQGTPFEHHRTSASFRRHHATDGASLWRSD